MANKIERDHADRKERNRLRSEAIAELAGTSPLRMKIALRRGEKVFGYSGKLTYCGEELLFEGEDDLVSPKSPVAFPDDAVKEYQALSEKALRLGKNKRLKTPEERTYVSEDELPCCLTQLSELEDKYPGIGEF